MNEGEMLIMRPKKGPDAVTIQAVLWVCVIAFGAMAVMEKEPWVFWCFCVPGIVASFLYALYPRGRRIVVSEEMQQQYIQVAEELSWIDREENGRYVMIPKTIAEFMYEGDIQHNCVYVCKYYKHVINRWSVIVFLREEKHTPFVTIEYEYGSFEVLQALGKYNQEISPELYRYVEELGERLRCEMMSRQ